MQAAQAIKAPKHGYDGHPPVMREVRDIPGRAARRIEGTQNIAVDRLEWYHAHGYIEQHHVDAGRRLQSDSELAQIGGYSAMGSGAVHSPHLGLADAKLDAIARVNRARAVLQPGVWRLLELVVLGNLALEVAGNRLWGRHVPRKVRMAALVHALGELAAHYGMA